jgi:hypothetical protein
MFEGSRDFFLVIVDNDYIVGGKEKKGSNLFTTRMTF